MKFIDSIEIIVESGCGGSGLVSFRAAKNLPKLGPDGGDGGFGGDVFLVGTSKYNTLSKLYYKRLYKAEDGEKGGTNGRTGKSGNDLFIEVPLGTIARTIDTSELLGEVIEEKDTLLLCKGGKRGLGNQRFVSSIHQIPEESTPGGDSINLNIKLELKLMADIGFAGFPNSGKSTLLSKITRATPKIADYPFTTLTPQLGVIDLSEENRNFYGESFVVADIPGLIEGASDGRGLGHEFLRHLERTKMIAYLLDPFCLERENSVESFLSLQKELESFSNKLSQKNFLIILTKKDIAPSEFDYNKLIEKLKTYCADIFVISSVSGEGIPELKRFLYQKVEEMKIQRKILEDKSETSPKIELGIPEDYETVVDDDEFEF